MVTLAEKTNQSTSILNSQFMVGLATAIYASSLMFFLEHHVVIEWRAYGFYFGSVTLLDVGLLALAIFSVTFVLPKIIDSPSSLMLVVIHFFVYVPAVVVIVGLDRSDASSELDDLVLLLALTTGFVLANLICRTNSWVEGNRQTSVLFLPVIAGLWTLGLLVLVVNYRSVMSFASLDVLYIQRKAGAAQNIFAGYLQTYFGYVLSPALVAFGLYKRKYLFVLMGIVGGLVLYMITAEKAVLTYPVFMIVMYFAMILNKAFIRSTSFIAVVFATLLFLSALFYKNSSVAEFVAWHLGVRSFITPGAFVVFYSDYFGEHGYTYWSNLSGLSLLIEAPPQYAAHRRWPSLGHIVGEDYIRVETLNANASFIASDGVACAGPIGIVLVFLLFAAYLKVLDRVSSGIPKAFLLTALVPLSLTLTNASIFTTMSSFGGFLTLVVLRYAFKYSGPPRVLMGSPRFPYVPRRPTDFVR